jgi:hypothetical protein
MIAQEPPPDRRPGGRNHSRETDDSIVPQCIAKTAVRLCSSQRHKKEARQNLSDAVRLRGGRKRTGSSNPSRSASLAAARCSLHEVVGNKPNNSSDLLFELRTSSWQCWLILLQKAHFLSEALDCADLVRFSKIPTFRRAYEFQRKEILRLFSGRREHPRPIRNVEVRILPPQPAIPACGECGCRSRKARR